MLQQRSADGSETGGSAHRAAFSPMAPLRPLTDPTRNGSGGWRVFSIRGAWVKRDVKRWSLPGSWFSQGSVARPMMRQLADLDANCGTSASMVHFAQLRV